MTNDNEARLVEAVRKEYNDWLKSLDVPTFTPPVAAGKPALAPDGAGLTAIARSGDKTALVRQLGPWLPGYLRQNKKDEGQADAFLAYILKHLNELGDRRFRDLLPEWLSAFTGSVADPVPTAFVAATAVDITLAEIRPNEAVWTRTYCDYLRGLDLASPDDLLSTPVPDGLKDVKALPSYRRELYRSALRSYHQGLQLFELSAAA